MIVMSTPASTAVKEAMEAAGTKLKSNDAINGAFDFLTKGFKDTYSNMSKGDGVTDAVKKAYSKNGDGTGGLALGAIAGSYMTASAGYRLVSGGGVYRDKNGNTNLTGVPFV
jgi:hypothetical protein